MKSKEKLLILVLVAVVFTSAQLLEQPIVIEINEVTSTENFERLKMDQVNTSGITSDQIKTELVFIDRCSTKLKMLAKENRLSLRKIQLDYRKSRYLATSTKEKKQLLSEYRNKLKNLREEYLPQVKNLKETCQVR